MQLPAGIAAEKCIFTENLKIMDKLNKLLKGLWMLAKRPALINHVINNEQSWKRHSSRKYGMEEGFPLLELNTLFPRFEASVPVFAFLDGGSLPTDIALLMKLADNIDNCRYFEIGTWRGESAANLASVASECYTLNLGDEEMRKLGLPEKYIGLHAHFSRKLSNVKHIKGNSQTYDFASLGKKFDLIFIDGDHHYEYVKNDTQKVFEHLVHDDSIVVWHDYARNPEMIRYDVMSGILDALPPEEHKHLYHVGNTLSAIYTRKELPAGKLDIPVEPRHFFEVDIRIKNK